jgi:hypothetical protein
LAFSLERTGGDRNDTEMNMQEASLRQYQDGVRQCHEKLMEKLFID